jgi:hypothetical protein
LHQGDIPHVILTTPRVLWCPGGCGAGASRCGPACVRPLDAFMFLFVGGWDG